jgi:hypothetical protein
LLKVEELKLDYSDPGSSEWWRQDKFSNSIDTIISSEGILSAKFLPGEGKIFKVTVIKPDNSLEGYLDNSNQTKLVAHPILNYLGEETDYSRYHMVFHKNNPNDTTKRSVYYARSQLVKGNLITDNIIWETPVNISDTIHYKTGNYDDVVIVDTTDCAYPSIVVRPVGNSVKAFVAFSWKFADTTTADGPPCDTTIKKIYNPIVEAVFDVNGPMVTYNDTAEVVVRRVAGADLQEKGTPVINASAKGNFFAWGNDECGLGYGYKSLVYYETSPIQELELINWTDGYDFGGRWDHIYAKHPSLNPYSHLNYGHNTASLAFVGTHVLNSNEFNFVGYTLLKIDSLTGNVTHFLMDKLNDLPIVDDNIIRLSVDPDVDYPVIYRPNERFDTLSYFPWDFNRQVSESVVWTKDDKSIVRRVVSYLPFNPGKYLLHNLQSIEPSYPEQMAFIIKLNQPNISQGNSVNLDDNGFKDYDNIASDVLNLDFKSTENDVSDPLNPFVAYEGIYHTNIRYNSLFNAPNALSTVARYIPNISEGKLSHLSHYPISGGLMQTNLNHRVFETLQGSPPSLIPNVNYFYRQGVEEVNSDAMVGFKYGIEDATLIGLPTVDGSSITLNLPYEEVVDSTLGTYWDFVDNDSIVSDWFYVGSSATLSYKTIFSLEDTTKWDFVLERQSTGDTTELPDPVDVNGFAYLVYYLINGQNDYYRLLLINRDTLYAEYDERLYLFGVDVIDTTYGRISAEGKTIVELNNSTYRGELNDGLTLNVFPNPADNTLYVSAHLPSGIFGERQAIKVADRVRITLYDQLGNKVLSQDIQAGSTIQFDTGQLSPGLYNIRADQILGSGEFREIPSASKQVIINR